MNHYLYPLNSYHSERLAQLNRDFQANEGKLSREHLERLEIFRSDVQKFLFESQKQHQLELKQMDIKLAWELRRFDRETAVVNMREQKILNESPIWEAAKIILNTHENSDVLPLHVFLSPPNLKYDERQNNTSVRGLPEMEQYLNGRIRDFFTAYSAQQRPINYLGASAWTSKMFRAEAATRSIFNCLKSEPTLIIESAVEGEEFELNFAYWGLGYVEPRYYNALRFSWCELLYDFAKKRTREWFNRREAEGEPESSWIADYGEETVQKYKHNLAIIQREEKCIARGDDLQDIARNYHIQSKDSEALKNHISICHCLFAGLLADEYFLLELSPQDRRPPLLTEFLPQFNANLEPSDQEVIITALVTAYERLYERLQAVEANWVPELKLELAEALMKLPHQFGALSQVKASLQAWLGLQGVEVSSGLEVSALLVLLRAKVNAVDCAYVDRLNQCLSDLGIDDAIDVATCCFERALQHYQQAAYRLTVLDLTQTLQLQPEYFAAYFHRGLAQAQLHAYPDAIADFDRVIAATLLPENQLLAPAYEQRGLAFYKLRNYDGAIADFDQAMRLGSSSAQGHREMAVHIGEEIKARRAEEARRVEEEKLRQEREAEERRRQEALRQAEAERQRQEAERIRAEAERQQREAEAERLRQEEEANGKWFSFETVFLNAQGQITRREQKQARCLAFDVGNGVQLEMVHIPSGSFMMGSPTSEQDRNSNEDPQHQVNLQSFHLGKYPITQEQYQAVTGSNPSHFKGAKRPVENVSWQDAQEFCKKLSAKTGKQFCLPSEAQWEYACRAGTTTPFCFGETITPELANYDGTSTYGNGPTGQYRQQTTEVGSFPANNWGLHDMHGNVWEWCEDVWYHSYTGAPNDGSVRKESSTNALRLLRGGSWDGDPGYCRCAYRNWGDAGNRCDSYGFRVALSSLPGFS